MKKSELREAEICTHPPEKRVTYFTGEYHYANGEITDNVREMEYCLACGRTLPQPPDPECLDEFPF